MNHLSRRDFLKFIPHISASALASDLVNHFLNPANAPNIIIILLDALSANHMSLYGYDRETTPNLSHFADRSHVFHNHYSAANFTTPGTASLLTGMYPWTHRAFNLGGVVKNEAESVNLFSLLEDFYFRFAFSQNPYPDRLVSQSIDEIDRLLPVTSYSLRGNKLISDKVGKDRYLAAAVFEDFLFTLNSEAMGSSLFGYMYKSFAVEAFLRNKDHLWYPRGTPSVEGYTHYLNEEIYNGVYRELVRLYGLGSPFLAYFHLFSPHFPYKPGRRYWKLFKDDGFKPQSKPMHPFGFQLTEADVNSKRLLYDQQIAHVDAEFGSLIQDLESEALLDNSYIIVTSDHGEMFERGFFGHGEPILYEPVIKIPLLISTPGQSECVLVENPSSNIDVLPTVLSLTGSKIPGDVEGQILPGFGGGGFEDRAIFSIYAAQNSEFLPIEKAAIAMRKGNYKIIAYFGYPELEGVYELYDIVNDPEEILDLSLKDIAIFSQLKEELLDALSDANRPYQSK